MSKLLDISCVNRVKIECADELEKSIFSDVYKAALCRINDMITYNESLKSDDPLTEFVKKNEMSNVISFTGERGMGKSSAMLSLVYLLKKPMRDWPIWSASFLSSNTDVKFCVLPKVDAGLLTRESIFDDILAEMWNMFDEKVERDGDPQLVNNSTKDMFNRVREAYTRYYVDEKDSRRINSIRQMKELAGGLRLRDQFSRLVDSFLCYMTNCYSIKDDKVVLLISIDDLDLASGNMVEVLEQLLVFLSIPNVIILTTANIDKMIMSCQKKFAEEHMLVKDDPYYAKRIKEFAEQYVAKVLPRNSRIYMPILGNSFLEEYHISLIPLLGKKISGITLLDDVSVQDFPNIFFARYTSLLKPYPKNVVAENLRNLINRLNELGDIIKTSEKNIKEELYDWLEKDIIVEAGRLSDISQYDFFNDFIMSPDEILNKRIIYFLDNTLGEYYKNNPDLKPLKRLRYLDPMLNNGYGNVLRTMVEYRGTPFDKSGLINNVAKLYSLRIARRIEKDREENSPIGSKKAVRNKLEELFIVDDLLDSIFLVSYEIKLHKDHVMINNLFRLFLEQNDSPIELIKNNKKTFDDIFSVMLFCNIREILSELKLVGIKSNKIVRNNNEQEDSSEIQSLRWVQINANPLIGSASIDYFFRNLLDYCELYQVFYLNIYTKINNIFGFKSADIDRKALVNILQLEGRRYTFMKNWTAKNNKFGIKKITDLIPIQNVAIMLDAVDNIKHQMTISSVYPGYSNITGALTLFVKAFVEVFNKAEDEMSIFYENKYRYCDRMEELIDILDNSFINNKLFEKVLINKGDLYDANEVDG